MCCGTVGTRLRSLFLGRALCQKERVSRNHFIKFRKHAGIHKTFGGPWEAGGGVGVRVGVLNIWCTHNVSTFSAGESAIPRIAAYTASARYLSFRCRARPGLLLRQTDDALL